MLLVSLVPDLLRKHRIADFGGNVYMLYVAEMTQNFRLLLLIYTPEQAEKCKVTVCNLQFLRIAHYGKKPLIAFGRLGKSPTPISCEWLSSEIAISCQPQLKFSKSHPITLLTVSQISSQ